jgi:anti-anti-sigma factor
VNDDAGFEIDTLIARRLVRVVVRGELDMTAREALVEEATAGLQRGDDGAVLELDLRDVTFADSSGLTGLVRCSGLTPGRAVVLLDPPPAVRGPLVRTGLDVLFLERHLEDGSGS